MKKQILFIIMNLLLVTCLCAGGLDIGNIIDNNGLEVIAVGSDGQLFAWKNNAELIEPFPVFLSNRWFCSGPELNNLDLSVDGVEEIVVLSKNQNEVEYKIHILNNDGSVITNISVPYSLAYDSLITADMIRTNTGLEIIVGDQYGQIHFYNIQGTENTNYTLNMELSYTPYACVIDYNSNGTNDMIVTCQNRIILYKWDNSLNTWSLLWEYDMESNSAGKAVCMDIDSNGSIEILSSDTKGNIYLLNTSGDLIWQRTVKENIISSPLIEFIDNDDQKDIVVCSIAGEIYAFTLEGDTIELDPQFDLNNENFPISIMLTLMNSQWGTDIKFKGVNQYNTEWGFFNHYTNLMPLLKKSLDTTLPAVSWFKSLSFEAGYDVIIQCNIIDDEYNVLTGDLYYRTNPEDEFKKIKLTKISTNYQTVIPAQDAVVGTIEYYFVVNDGFGNSAQYPSSSYLELELEDTQGPRALCMSLGSPVSSLWPYIDAEIYAFEAVSLNTNSLVLHWKVYDQFLNYKGEGSSSLNVNTHDLENPDMVRGRIQLFRNNINLESQTGQQGEKNFNINKNDIINFWVAGQDKEDNSFLTNHNNMENPLKSINAHDQNMVLLHEDFEDLNADDFIVEKGKYDIIEQHNNQVYSAFAHSESISRYAGINSANWKNYEYRVDIKYNGKGFKLGWAWQNDTYNGKGYFIEYNEVNKRICKKEDGFIFIMADLSSFPLYENNDEFSVSIDWNTETGESRIKLGPYEIAVTNTKIKQGSVWFGAQGSEFDNVHAVARTKPEPLSPKNLSAVPVKYGYVKLIWNEPDKQFDSDKVYAYNIYRTENPDITKSLIQSEVVPKIGQQERLYFIDKNTEHDKTYYYTITALDNYNQESQPANETWCRSDGKAYPPYSITVTELLNGSVKITWLPDETEPAIFNIYRSTSSNFLKQSANIIQSYMNQNYIIDTVNDDEKYFYGITAVDICSNESDLSDIISVDCDIELIDGDIVLDELIIDHNQAVLSWSFSGDSDDVDHYIVYRSEVSNVNVNNSSAVYKSPVLSTVSSFTDHFVGEETYYYCIGVVYKKNHNIRLSNKRVIDREGPVISIVSPNNNQQMNQSFNMLGHVFDKGDKGLNYTLEYSDNGGLTYHLITSGNTEKGVLIKENGEKVHSDSPADLGFWDISLLTPNYYLLRLKAKDGHNNINSIIYSIQIGDADKVNITSQSVLYEKRSRNQDYFWYNLYNDQYDIYKYDLDNKQDIQIKASQKDELIHDDNQAQLIYSINNDGQLQLFFDHTIISNTAQIHSLKGVFSASKEWISFHVINDQYNYELYTADVNNSLAVSTIGNSPDTDTLFKYWFIDPNTQEEKLIFQTFDKINNNYDILISDKNGSTITPLADTDNNEIIGETAIQDDVIGYTVMGRTNKIVLYSLKTSSVLLEMTNTEPIIFHAFNPKSKRIAYSVNNNDQTALIIYNYEDQQIEKVLQDAQFAGWAPNGCMLAYHIENNNMDINIYDLASDQISTVVENIENDMFCDWDLSSSALVYSLETDSGNQLKIAYLNNDQISSFLTAKLSLVENNGTNLFIKGTASGNRFKNYSLSIKNLIYPADDAVEIINTDITVINDNLGIVSLSNTNMIKGDGFYQISLVSIDSQGRKEQDEIIYNITNSDITNDMNPVLSDLSVDENTISFYLSKPGTIDIHIYNDDGLLLYSINTNVNNGDNSVIWNGFDTLGVLQKYQDYNFSIQATAPNNQKSSTLYSSMRPPVKMFVSADYYYISPNNDGSQDRTVFSIKINRSDRVKVAIYSSNSSQLVKTLWNDNMVSLPYINEIIWYGKDENNNISEGTYLCKIVNLDQTGMNEVISIIVDMPAEDETVVHKMIDDAKEGFLWGAWSSQSEQLVYSRFSNQARLNLLKGTNERIQLSVKEWSDYYSDWTSDGNTICFMENQCGEFKLMMKDLEGSLYELDFGIENPVSARINPNDSSIIAYQIMSSSSNLLYLAKLNSNYEVVNNVLLHTNAFFKAWSPNGEYYVYNYLSDTQTDVYLEHIDSNLNIDLSIKVTNTQDEIETAGEQCWSPDGSMFVYQTRDTIGNQDIHVFVLSNFSSIDFAVNVFYNEDFMQWSPKGNLIAYHEFWQDTPRIVIKNIFPEFTDKMIITNALFTEWLNDGFRFIYNKLSVSKEKYSIGLADFALKEISMISENTEISEKALALSLNSKRLAYEQTTPSHSSLQIITLPEKYDETILAQISFPYNSYTVDDQIDPVIDIKGTAYTRDIAYYKLEIKKEGQDYQWHTLIQTNVAQVDNLLGTWHTGENLPDSSGKYNLKLTVSDLAGNSDYDVVSLYLTGNPVIYNVSTIENNVSYSVSEIVDLYLEIYADEGCTQLVRTIIENRIISGAHTTIWDGKDDYGKYVHYDQYYFKLKAVDQDNNQQYYTETGNITPSHIFNVSAENLIFSPNGDGIKDKCIISFTDNDWQNIKLNIYDAQGSLIMIYTNNYIQAEDNIIEWDGINLHDYYVADGIYTLIFSDRFNTNQFIIKVDVQEENQISDLDSNESISSNILGYNKLFFRSASDKNDYMAYLDLDNKYELNLINHETMQKIQINGDDTSAEDIVSWHDSDNILYNLNEFGTHNIYKANINTQNETAYITNSSQNIVYLYKNPLADNAVLQVINSNQYQIIYGTLTGDQFTSVKSFISSTNDYLFKAWINNSFLIQKEDENDSDVLVYDTVNDKLISIADNPYVRESTGREFVSKDNSKLIYHSIKDNSLEITIYDILSKNQTIISIPDASLSFQSWSYDSQVLSFIALQSNQKNLYIYDLNNNKSSMIDQDIESGGLFSPDDLNLMYTKRLNNNKNGIISYNVTSKRFYEFLNEENDDTFLTWLNSGTKVAYLRRTDSDESINTIKFKDTTENEIIADITSPVSDQIVLGYLKLYGKAYASDFEYYTLSYSKAGFINQWHTVYTSFNKIEHGLLGSIDTTEFPGDGAYLLKLDVYDLAGNFKSDSVQIVVNNFDDSSGPIAHTPSPLDSVFSTNKSITCYITDEGTGVNTNTIKIKINNYEYNIFNEALSYDTGSGFLSFYMNQAQPNPINFANGEAVVVNIVEAEDYAGNSLQSSLDWTWYFSTSIPVLQYFNVDQNKIDYQLNKDADISISIYEDQNYTVLIKTLILDQTHIKDTPYSVIWDGKNNDNTIIPYASCYVKMDIVTNSVPVLEKLDIIKPPIIYQVKVNTNYITPDNGSDNTNLIISILANQYNSCDIQIDIYNKDNTLIRRLENISLSKISNIIEWDLKDRYEQDVNEGQYEIVVINETPDSLDEEIFQIYVDRTAQQENVCLITDPVDQDEFGSEQDVLIPVKGVISVAQLSNYTIKYKHLNGVYNWYILTNVLLPESNCFGQLGLLNRTNMQDGSGDYILQLNASSSNGMQLSNSIVITINDDQSDQVPPQITDLYVNQNEIHFTVSETALVNLTIYSDEYCIQELHPNTLNVQPAQETVFIWNGLNQNSRIVNYDDYSFVVNALDYKNNRSEYITNNVNPPLLLNTSLDSESFSPNNDSVKDELLIQITANNYQMNNMIINVYNTGDTLVWSDTPVLTNIYNNHILWEGKDNGDTVLADGNYMIEIVNSQNSISITNRHLVNIQKSQSDIEDEIAVTNTAQIMVFNSWSPQSSFIDMEVLDNNQGMSKFIEVHSGNVHTKLSNAYMHYFLSDWENNDVYTYYYEKEGDFNSKWYNNITKKIININNDQDQMEVNPIVSSYQNLIAFQIWDNNNYSLVVVQNNGASVDTVLTLQTDKSYFPITWFDSGKKLLVQIEDVYSKLLLLDFSDIDNIQQKNIEKKNCHVITGKDCEQNSIKEKIALHIVTNHHSSIALYDVNTEQITKVIEKTESTFFNAWSADGQKIIYSKVINEQYDLYYKDIFSSEESILVKNAQYGGISKDSYILYVTKFTNNNHDIYAYNRNTKEMSPLINTINNEIILELSPDYKKLAYYDQDNNSIHLIQLGNYNLAAIETPEDGEFIKDQINITGTASSEELDRYILEYRYYSDTMWNQFYENSENIYSDDLAVFSTLTPGTDGQYYIRLTVFDISGISQQDTISVQIDNTVPLITITGVTDTHDYQGSVIPDITVVEPNIEQFQILLNNEEITNRTEISNSGYYTLKVCAKDLANNSSVTEVNFSIGDPAFAGVFTIPKSPITNTGEIKIIVQTSEPVTNTDILVLTPYEQFPINIQLSNSLVNNLIWTGYINITEEINDGPAVFSFKGVDLNGVTGTEITNNNILTIEKSDKSLISKLEGDHLAPVLDYKQGTTYLSWYNYFTNESKIYFKYIDQKESTNLLISKDLNQSSHPDLCALSNGSVYIVWQETSSEDKGVYFAQSVDKTNWTDPVKIGNGYKPKLCDLGGILVAVWEDNSDGNYRVYERRYNSQTSSWNSTVKINTLLDSNENSININIAQANNDLYLVYETETGIYYQKNLQAGWSDPERIYVKSDSLNYTMDPALYVDNDFINIVYHEISDNNDYDVLYLSSYDKGINWNSPVVITKGEYDAQSPDICGDYQGIYVTWQDNRDGNNEIYFKSSYDLGFTWTESLRCTFNSSNSVHPQITSVNTNQVIIVWEDNRDGHYQILLYDIYQKPEIPQPTGSDTDLNVVPIVVNSAEPEGSYYMLNLANVNEVYDIKPGEDGEITFPVYITFYYSDEELAGIEEENLVVFNYDDDIDEWVPAVPSPEDIIYDYDNNAITIKVNHLSYYGLFFNFNELNAPVLSSVNTPNNQKFITLNGTAHTNCYNYLYINDQFQTYVSSQTNGEFTINNVALNEGTNIIKVKSMSKIGEISPFSDDMIVIGDFTIPEISLISITPEPFIPYEEECTIIFNVSEPSIVTVEIYDKNNNLINRIMDSESVQDQTILKWDGKDRDAQYVKANIYRLKITVYDLAGNMNVLEKHDFSIGTDHNPPITLINIQPTYYSNQANYVNPNSLINLNSEDDTSAGYSTGVDYIEYFITNTIIDTQHFISYNQSISVPEEYTNFYIYFRAVDKAGNIEDTHTNHIIVDNALPETTFMVENSWIVKDQLHYINEDTKVYFSATDKGIGLAHIYYSDNNSVYNTATTNAIQFTEYGNHNTEYYAVDRVENKEITKSVLFFIDNAAPVSVINFNGENVQQDTNIYISPNTGIQITSQDDDIGLFKIQYAVLTNHEILESDWQDYNEEFTISSNGRWFVFYRGIDLLGNREETKYIKLHVPLLDTNAPVSMIAFNNPQYLINTNLFISGDTEITLSANDKISNYYFSGIRKIEYQINTNMIETNEWITYTDTFNTGTDSGICYIKYRSYDYNNNIEQVNLKTVYVDNDAPETVVGYSNQAWVADDIVYIRTNTYIKLLSTDTNFKPSSGKKEIYNVLQLNNDSPPTYNDYWAVYSNAINNTNSEFYLYYYAEDNLDNKEDIHAIKHIQDNQIENLSFFYPWEDKHVNAQVSVVGTVEDLLLNYYQLEIVSQDNPGINQVLYESGSIDINTCSRDDLLSINGVDGTMADEIIADRPITNFIQILALPSVTTNIWQSIKSNILLALNEEEIERFDSTVFNDGAYTLKLSAVDKLSNAYTIERTIHIDNSFPIAEIISPVSNTLIDATNVVIAGTANDENFDHYRVYIGSGYIPEQYINVGYYTNSIENNTLADIDLTGFWGIINIRIVVQDKADNVNMDSVIIRRIPELRINELNPQASIISRINWVEIYSMENQEIDAAKLILTDLDGQDTPLAESPVSIQSNQYILIHWSDGIDETDSVGDVNNNGIIDLYVSYEEISSLDDQLVLMINDQVVDAVIWSDYDGSIDSSEVDDANSLVDMNQWQGAFTTTLETNAVQLGTNKTGSVARRYKYIDSNSKYDWIFSDSTPGTQNDIVPPQISIISPADGLLTNDSIHVVWTVSDNFSDPEDILVFGYENNGLYTNEGSYTVVLYAVDEVFNTNSASVSFTIDKTKPKINITGVQGNGMYDTAQVSISVDIIEDNPVDQGSTLNGTSFNQQTNVTEEGDYTLFVWVEDVFGNRVETNLSFIIDRTAPIIGVSGVADGKWYDSAVTPVIDITDAHLETSVIELNGEAFISGTEVTNQGTNRLYVYAVDQAGHESISNIYFMIDTTPPQISIQGVSDGSAYNDPPKSAIITVTDDNLTVVYNQLNSAPYTSGDPITADGSYTLLVHAEDSVGHVVETNVHFIIDTIDPVISISGVEDGGLYNQNRTVDVSITEINLQTNYNLLTETISGTDILFTGAYEITNDGHYTLSCYAKDTAENETVTNLSFIIDTTPPIITVLNITNNGAYNSDVNVDVIIIEDNPETNYIQLNGVIYENSSFTVTDEDDYILYIYAKDTVNNESELFIEFIIDKTPPLITVTGVTQDDYYNHDVSPVITIEEEHDYTSNIALNGSPFISGTPVTDEDDYTLQVDAEDIAQNQANTTIDFGIDKTAPEIHISGVIEGGIYQEVTPVIDIVEDHLDTVNTTYTLNNDSYTSGTPINEVGDYTLIVHALDLAGNKDDEEIHFTIEHFGITNTLWFFASYDYKADADFAVGCSNVIEGGKRTKHNQGRFGGEALSENGIGAMYHSSSNVNLTNGTIVMWVKPKWKHASGKGRYFLWFNNDDGKNYALCMVVYKNHRGTTLRFRDSSGIPHEFSVDTGPEQARWYADKDWAYLAFNWDAKSGFVNMYINNKLAGSFTDSPWIPAPHYNFWIGNKEEDKKKCHEGQGGGQGKYKSKSRIDEFKIFSKVLSHQQIMETGYLYYISGLSSLSNVVMPVYLNKHDEYYVDRDYILNHIPKELKGSLFLMTANNDKQVPEDQEYISFTAERDIDVYIAFDKRVDDKPDWLDEFEPYIKKKHKKQEKIKVTDHPMKYLYLYKKTFDKGDIVSLGGNNGQSNKTSNYIVIIK